MYRHTRRTFVTGSALSATLLAGHLDLVRAQEATPAATPEAPAPPQALLPAEWGQVQGQTAPINGIEIYYEVYGDGEPLVMIHGGLGNGTYFAFQIPVLAEHYQVIVMDSRGHGRSTFDDQPINYELMAKDVVGLLDHLSIDKANIVGWSDGGIIGIELALTVPERLIEVVAFGANIDPSGVRLDVGTNAYFNAYIDQAYLDYQTLSPNPERWDEFIANITNMWATEPNYTWDELGTITTPILILDGELEEAIDLNQTKLMYFLIPGSTLHIIPGTGHFAFMEKPDEFNQIVLDYLAGTLATPIPG